MKFRFLLIVALTIQSFLNAVPEEYGQSAQTFFDAANKWILQGEYDKASLEFEKVKRRFPNSESVPLAEFQIGLCFLYTDHPVEAALQFQKLIQRYPSSEQAARAAEMNTLIYRLYLAPPAERRVYTVDPTFTVMIPELDDPSGMAIDSKQNIYISDKGKKVVYIFDKKGIRTNTMIAMAPYSISVDSNDQAMIANDMHVILPGKDPVSFRSGLSDTSKPVFLQEIRSVAANRAGNFFVVSRKSPGILVFNPNREPVSTPAFPKTYEFHKVLVNSKDEVIALDKDRKQLFAYGRDGRTLFTIQPTPQVDFDKVADFALDSANHIYLLTDNPKGILIFSPAGKLLRYIPSAKKSPIEFEDGKVIAVSSSGTIFVLDKDLKRVLKVG